MRYFVEYRLNGEMVHETFVGGLPMYDYLMSLKPFRVRLDTGETIVWNYQQVSRKNPRIAAAMAAI